MSNVKKSDKKQQIPGQYDKSTYREPLLNNAYTNVGYMISYFWFYHRPRVTNSVDVNYTLRRSLSDASSYAVLLLHFKDDWG